MAILRRRKIIVVFILSLLLLFLFRITLKLAVRDFIYLVRPIWDSQQNVPENLIPHFYADSIPQEDLCSLHGWKPRDPHDKPKVIDAFIFSIELDMLEIRIKELWEVVDTFVIVEADRTFTGSPKPLYFLENKERFLWAEEKLVHYVMKELSEFPKKEFQNEARTRGYMTGYIKSLNPSYGDLIIVGDIDELPYAHTIQLLKTCQGYPRELHLEMQNYIYSFEFRLQTTNWRPRVTTFESFSFGYHHGRASSTRLADAGWHCSFCFRHISDFIFKMTSYSHTDRVTRERLLEKSEIQKKICNGADIFDMLPEAYTFQDLIAQLGKVPKISTTIGIPKYIVENPNKFKFLLPNGCKRDDDVAV